MKTAELIEQRAAIVARMNDAHTADNGDAFTAAETELRSLDAKLQRARALDAADRADPGTTIHGEDTPAEIREQSIVETIRYAAGLPCDRAKVEREQSFLERRAGGQIGRAHV